MAEHAMISAIAKLRDMDYMKSKMCGRLNWLPVSFFDSRLNTLLID